MRNSYIILLLLFFSVRLINAQDYSQITIFGNRENFRWEKYAFKVNNFKEGEIANTDPAIVLRICESIDNSKMIVFGYKCSIGTFNHIFDQQPIRTSIKSLLQRGGLIYFGPLEGPVITSFPNSMKTFFSSIGAGIIDHSNYNMCKNELGLESNKKGIPYDGYKGELLTTPNSSFDIIGVRHFGKIPKNVFQPIFLSPEGDPLMIIQENILGKGSIVFSNVHNILRATDDNFVVNLIWKAYGPVIKVSDKAVIKKNLITGSIPPENEVITLHEPRTVSLFNWKENKEPLKSTSVSVSIEKNNLLIDFVCFDPEIQNIKADIGKNDADVWNDDCVEVIIADGNKNSSNLFHFIVNSIGTIYDAKNNNAAWNADISVKTDKRSDAWLVSMEIPFDQLSADIGSLHYFKINLCREEKEIGEQTSWNKALHEFTDMNSLGWATQLSYADFSLQLLEESKELLNKITFWHLPVFTKIYNDVFPADEEEIDTISIVVARNEKESASILISNTTEDNLYFRMEPQYHINDSILFSDVLTIKETIPWRDPTGIVFSEALTRVNEGNIISVPSYETRQICIDIKTMLPAGEYQWGITFVPTNMDVKTKKVSLKINVLPFTFPEKLPIDIYTFGPYGGAFTNDLRKEYIDICKDYHINYIQTSNGPGKAISKNEQGEIVVSDNRSDYIAEESLLKELGYGWVYGYGVYSLFMNELKKYDIAEDIDNEKIQKIFREWIRNWIKYLEQEGVDFSKTMFPIKDEPYETDIKNVVIAANIMHDIKPEVRTCVTIATWSTLPSIEKLNHGIDVWMPWEPRVTTREGAEKELNFYRSTGKNFLPYLCSTSGNTASYLQYFRFRGIRSSLMGADGFALWAYNSWRGNDWNSAENVDNYSAFLFHHADRGPVPTLRAEAFREAAEDLFMINEAKRYNDPELVRLISHENLNLLMLQNDPLKVQQWRDRLLTALSRVSQSYDDK